MSRRPFTAPLPDPQALAAKQAADRRLQELRDRAARAQAACELQAKSATESRAAVASQAAAITAECDRLAAKAALLSSPRKRSLLYFLQSRSVRMGGMRHVGEEFLAMFPERIGTRTMHRVGIKPGVVYSLAEAGKIEDELDPDRSLYRRLRRAQRMENGEPDDTEAPVDRVEKLMQSCRRAAADEIENVLAELCANPRVTIRLPEDAESELQFEAERRALVAAIEHDGINGIETVGQRWFYDLAGALLEYQDRYEAGVAREFVQTSISKVVFEALDYGLHSRKMVLIEGNSGVGKTESVKAWCAMHQGRARHVSLSGICNRTSFFRALARALGVGVGAGYSAAKTQARVEDFVERARLMLVVDEGQYLFPQQERVNAPPELVNWLITSCQNKGAPVAVVATKEFARRRQIVERQTAWSSEQLARRNTCFPLPELPTKGDLEAVARKLLPANAGPKTVGYLVGYAMQSGRFLTGLGDVVSDARMLAEADGREGFTSADIERAVTDIRGPSDAAQRRVFEEEAPLRKGRKARSQTPPATEAAAPLPTAGSGAAATPRPQDLGDEESSATAGTTDRNRIRFGESVPA